MKQGRWMDHDGQTSANCENTIKQWNHQKMEIIRRDKEQSVFNFQ